MQIASEQNHTMRGEALQTLLVVLASVAIIALAVGAYLHFAEKPVEPSGAIGQMWVYPIHRESTMGGGPNNAAAVKQPFDEVLVLAKVKVNNPGKIPIYIREMTATVALPQGETHDSVAAGASDYKQIFVAYPETAAHKQDPLLRETAIAPGASAEGLVVFSYQLTKEQWDTRTALTPTISFIHQADIILKSPQS
jgi:hypothetical protein